MRNLLPTWPENFLLALSFCLKKKTINFGLKWAKLSKSWKWIHVFSCCSVWFFCTFWPNMNKICIVLPEIFSKNLYFDRFSYIFRRTRFFTENPASSVCTHYCTETSCEVSERSYDGRTNMGLSIGTNLLYWSVQKCTVHDLITMKNYGMVCTLHYYSFVVFVCLGQMKRTHIPSEKLSAQSKQI